MNILKSLIMCAAMASVTLTSTAQILDQTHDTTMQSSQLAYNEYNSSGNRIKTIAKQAQLVYFFKGNCVYCNRFAPVLKKFAAHYGFTIIPISLDGRGMNEFPNTQQLTKSYMNIDIPVVPTVYIKESTTGALTPISYGSINEDELLQRILNAI